MDAIDKKIIGKLKENSRLTWKELGEEIHMTGQAVGARVERLIERKKIRRFTVEVAYDYTEFITMYMGSQDYGVFENTMAVNPNVESVYKISGDGCYLLTAHFSPGELDNFCKELLNYGRYKVNISIKQVK